MPDKVEQPVIANLSDKIVVGGTYDAIQGDTLIDYKTTGKKPNTESIPFGYKIQLLAYVWALRQKGVNIDRIRIVWVVRPTKTLPARVFVVTQVITQDDWKMIEDTLTIIKDTVELQEQHPEYKYLLYKSMQLKEN
jgi:hypothetical protein